MDYWVVRAGRADEQRVQDIEGKLREDRIVGIGWSEIGDFGRLSQADIKQALIAVYHDSPQTAAANAGQLYRFAHTIKNGDIVLTPIVPAGKVFIGEVIGQCQHNPQSHWDYILSNTRAIEWLRTDVQRSDLSLTLDETLRCGLTVYNANSDNKNAQEIDSLIDREVHGTLDNQSETAQREGMPPAREIPQGEDVATSPEERASTEPEASETNPEATRQRRAERTSRHQRLVQAFAERFSDFRRWVGAFDYAVLAPRGVALAEMKTLGENSQDEVPQVRHAVGQLLYYQYSEHRCLPSEFEGLESVRIAVFDNKPADAHIRWMESLDVAVVWQAGEQFFSTAASNRLVAKVCLPPFEEGA